jgi:hypothetical protein
VFHSIENFKKKDEKKKMKKTKQKMEKKMKRGKSSTMWTLL